MSSDQRQAATNSKLTEEHLRQLELLAQVYEAVFEVGETVTLTGTDQPEVLGRQLDNLLSARDDLEPLVLGWLTAAGLNSLFVTCLQASLLLEAARLGYQVPAWHQHHLALNDLYEQVSSVLFVPGTPGMWGAARVSAHGYRRLLSHLLSATGSSLVS